MQWRTEYRVLRTDVGSRFLDGDEDIELQSDWRFFVTPFQAENHMQFTGYCYLVTDEGIAQAIAMAHAVPVPTPGHTTAYAQLPDLEEFFESQIREQLYDLLRRTVTATGALADISFRLPITCPRDVKFKILPPAPENEDDG